MVTEQDIGGRLAHAYGVALPAPFVRLVWQAYEAASEDGHVNDSKYVEHVGMVFEWAGPIMDLAVQYGKEPATPASGYRLTPPELLTFGWPGEGGLHCGFVVHAPELNATDFPLAEFDPMDSETGVSQLGIDARSGLEFLLSRRLYWLARDYPPDDRFRLWCERRIAAIAGDLAIAPTAENGDRAPAPVTAPVPAGWRFEPSDDGVGVLAPAGAFAAGASDVNAIEEVVGAAAGWIDAGHPATALLRVRNAFWRERYAEGAFEAVKHVWAAAYLALDRPLLARALDWPR